jgi:transcriptional regulator with GAF, ATPase, and Fis domain
VEHSPAVRHKAGLFQVAGNGTLFLDETGEVAPTVAGEAARALQEREIRRVGAKRTIKVHARVVAATYQEYAASEAAVRRLMDQVATTTRWQQRPRDVAIRVIAAKGS